MRTRKRRGVVWTTPRETLVRLVNKHKHVSRVLQELGLSGAGSQWQALRDRLAIEGIPLENQSHNKLQKQDILDRLVPNSTTGRTFLKKKLLELGLLENRCYVCDLPPVWNGKPLPMILDHINGVYNDNRLENLQLVCPNCSLQLDTYGSRNKPYKKVLLSN